MKRVCAASFSTLALLCAVSALAQPQAGIICREDNRLNNGALRELILTPTAQGYALQVQYVPSLSSSELKIETWAQDLKCRLDEKTSVAFCQNNENQVVLLKERREVFYESLEVDKNKKTTKHIDASLIVNNQQQKVFSFSANHCQNFGGDI